ncbi:MAG: hypothetical protein WCQ99_12100 [Pseudomonadota bacterium]
MKLYKEILTTTLETVVNHYGKDQFADLTTSFICQKCNTAYMCFPSSDLILYNPENKGWRVFGVLEDNEKLEDICDCA